MRGKGLQYYDNRMTEERGSIGFRGECTDGRREGGSLQSGALSARKPKDCRTGIYAAGVAAAEEAPLADDAGGRLLDPLIRSARLVSSESTRVESELTAPQRRGDSVRLLEGRRPGKGGQGD